MFADQVYDWWLRHREAVLEPRVLAVTLLVVAALAIVADYTRMLILRMKMVAFSLSSLKSRWLRSLLT